MLAWIPLGYQEGALTGIATTGPAAFSLKDKPRLAMAIAAARSTEGPNRPAKLTAAMTLAQAGWSWFLRQP
jgi:hypothetical protein